VATKSIGKLNILVGVDASTARNDIEKLNRSVRASMAQMKQSISGLQKDFKMVSTAVGGLEAALGGVAIGSVVKDIIQTADAVNQLQAKVKNSLGDIREFDSVFKQIVASSNRTGTAVDSVAQAFVRLRPAAERLGVTNQELIQFNETFSKMGALAGATSQEVSNAMIQLAQGIASNRLGGDELRSVLEQMPPIAQAIATQMKIPIEKLKDVAKEGKITAEVVLNAVLSKTKEVDQQFSTLPASVDRSVNKMANSGTIWIGKLNQTLDITGFVSKEVDKLAGIIDDLTSSMNSSGAQSNDLNSILRDVVGTASSLYGTVKNIVSMTVPLSKFFAVAATGARVAALGMEGTGMFLNEGVIGLQASWKSIGANNDKQAQAWKDSQIQNMYKESFDRNRSFLEELGLVQPKYNIPTVIPKIKTPSLGGHFGGGGSGSGSGTKGKRKKTDAENELERLKNEAKSMTENMRSIWEVERDEIAKADKFLKMHLISMETYNRAVIEAKNNAKQAFKIEGVDDAVKKFMEPHKKFLDDFKPDLGDALSDPAFQQDLRIQETVDGLKREIEETQRLTAARLEGVKSYDLMTAKIEAENNVRSLGLDLQSAAGQQIYDLSMAFDSAQRKAAETSQSMQEWAQIGQQVGSILTNGFNQWIMQGMKFTDVLKQVGFELIKIAAIKAGTKLIGMAIGALAGGGGGAQLGGSISGMVGDFGTSGMGDVQFAADGAQARAGQPFIVGEEGMELFVPKTSGTIIPNHALAGAAGGGSNVYLTQNIYLQATDAKSFEDRIYEHGKTIGKLAVNAVQKQQNRMGRSGPMDTGRG
jgi:tape measure domain-containing protein